MAKSGGTDPEAPRENQAKTAYVSPQTLTLLSELIDTPPLLRYHPTHLSADL
jgi:hypothetical protein